MARVLDPDAPTGCPKSARVPVGKLTESQDNLAGLVDLARRAVDLAHIKAGMAAVYNVGEVTGEGAVVARVAEVFVPRAAGILRAERRRKLVQGKECMGKRGSTDGANERHETCGCSEDAEEAVVHGEPVVQQQKGRFRVCLEGPAPLSVKGTRSRYL